MASAEEYPRIFIVTGVAGSGRTTALRILEDLRFYCIDNLPVALLPHAVELAVETKRSELRGLALGLDARERLFFPEWPRIFAELEHRGHRLEVIFLDASDEVIMRRYSESRRPHPLANVGVTLAQGIRRERLALAELRERANRVIETTALSTHELRAVISSIVLGARHGAAMVVELVSFGYKYGMPIGLDIVQDVRFIPNPFFVEELRPLSGLEPQVRAFVLKQSAAQTFLDQFEALLATLLPLYQSEGRSYLSIGIGCTGGRHRAPVLAGEMAARLSRMGYHPNVRHQHISL